LSDFKKKHANDYYWWSDNEKIYFSKISSFENVLGKILPFLTTIENQLKIAAEKKKSVDVDLTKLPKSARLLCIYIVSQKFKDYSLFASDTTIIVQKATEMLVKLSSIDGSQVSNGMAISNKTRQIPKIDASENFIGLLL